MKTTLVNLKGGAKLLFNRQTEVNGISVVFCFNAGAINDPKGKLGVAHFCEHALCGFSNGVMTRKEREDARNNFQYYNARTSKYFMTFIVRVTDKKLEEALDYLTEPFASLKLNKDEFEFEQSIIRDEISTRQKLNGGVANQIHNTEILKDKNANNLISNPAGTIETFDKITIKDLKNFIDKYVTLNNLTVMVVGNTKLSKIKKLANKYIEQRVPISQSQGYLQLNPEINKPCYHFRESVEKGKALLEFDYYIKKLPFNFTPHREQYVSRFVKSILNELIFKFYRVENKLTYGCDAFVGNSCDWLVHEVCIPCSEENLQKVIDAYPKYLEYLPENLPKDLFDKYREKFFNSYEFDFMNLDSISNACFENYYYERKLFGDQTRKLNRKKFESVTYEEANELYKILFSVKPHIMVISNNQEYKNYKFKYNLTK